MLRESLILKWSLQTWGHKGLSHLDAGGSYGSWRSLRAQMTSYRSGSRYQAPKVGQPLYCPESSLKVLHYRTASYLSKLAESTLSRYNPVKLGRLKKKKGYFVPKWNWEISKQLSIHEKIYPTEYYKHKLVTNSVQFSCSVMSDFATPWTAVRHASLSIINSRSLLKLMSNSYIGKY